MRHPTGPAKAVLLPAGRLPGHVRAAVLVLHGGRVTSRTPAAARQLASLRMVPVARRLARLPIGGLAVWRLRYRYRGWNDPCAHPVADARWALAEVRRRHGRVPVVLVGHSMGGRAVLRAADEPAVVGVVALAPWIPDGEPLPATGRRLLVVHGERDRVTDPRRSAAFVDDVRASAAQADWSAVPSSGHAMLRHCRVWDRLAADFVLEVLSGVAAGQQAGDT